MTYNQVITLLKNIAEAHQFIKSFGHGEAWEINSNDTFKDYVLWVIPIDSSTLENTKNRTFTILVFRRVDKAKLFETEILSNCEQILDDVIRILRNHSNDFNLIGNPIEFPFKEEFGDWCAGWRADLVIETNFANNYCDIPSETFVFPTPNNNASYVVDSNGNIIKTLYPGQVYTQLSDMVNVITTPYPNATGTTFAATDATKIIGVFFNTGRLNETNDYTISGNNVVLNTAAANDYITIVEVSS